MLTLLSMITALVALAAVVVTKAVAVELLAAEHRRYARLQEQLEQVRSQLRVAATQRAAAEREWRGVEHRRHRTNVHIALCHETIGLFELGEASRQAHFDLLAAHLIDR